MNKVFTAKVPNTNAGFGAIKTLPDEVKRFRARKPLIITDKGLVTIGLVKTATDLLAQADIEFSVFDELSTSPSTDIVDQIGEIVRERKHDLLIGFGGGTAIDITKASSVTAIAKENIGFIMDNPLYPELNGPFLPKIYIPTTAGTGSEWSNVVVLFQYAPVEREIITFSWDYMGDKVIIDPELTKGLPARVTADTGFDALCHAMEAYVTPDANVYTDMMAVKAIEMISTSLRPAVTNGSDMDARYNMSLAAAFAMNACGTGGAGLAHLMNEIIVPYTKVSHGTALAVIAPAAMDFNVGVVQAKYAHIAELLGEDIEGLPVAAAAAKAPAAVRQLILDINLPSRMGEIGITRNDVPILTKRLMDINGPVIPIVNPRAVSAEEAESIFMAAL